MIYTRAEVVRICNTSNSALYRAIDKLGITGVGGGPQKRYSEEDLQRLQQLFGSRNKNGTPIKYYRVIVLMTELDTVCGPDAGLTAAWVVKRSGLRHQAALKVRNEYQDLGYLAKVKCND